MARACLSNDQREDPVPVAWLSRLAGCAVKRLGITQPGELRIAFISADAMRRLNRRFMRRRALTDVLSFRYAETAAPRVPPRVIGEVLIAPRAAKRYAAQAGLPYRAELARYVVHGLLHWLGHDDRTAPQQRRMRALEDQLLAQCS